MLELRMEAVSIQETQSPILQKAFMMKAPVDGV